MSWKVVVLSRNHDNLVECERAIWRNERDAYVVVVEDEGLVRLEPHEEFLHVEYVKGESPFCYARNANIGIRAAVPDDVILLNDDALLQTPGGFTAMAEMVRQHPNVGALAAKVDGVVGNPAQGGFGPSIPMVCFVCVYIPRRIFNAVGPLDERFVHYGYDDDDYCRRVQGAGFEVGINTTVVVEHKSLPSTYRQGNWHPLMAANKVLFDEKWGTLKVA